MSKSVLVLGGTAGLGLAIARSAIGRGFLPVIVGRTAGKCELIHKGQASGYDLDLTSDVALPSRYLESFDMIFWAAGVQQKGCFTDLKHRNIQDACRVYLEGPATVLSGVFRHQIEVKRPFHLVVIGSSTSWRVREDESLYGALKAAQAQLARALGKELPRDLLGSKVLLAHPGGMATPFWKNDNETDTSRFMKPEAVAQLLWEQVLAQEVPFREIQIVRQPDGTPKLEEGARLPQM